MDKPYRNTVNYIERRDKIYNKSKMNSKQIAYFRHKEFSSLPAKTKKKRTEEKNKTAANYL